MKLLHLHEFEMYKIEPSIYISNTEKYVIFVEYNI